MRKYDNEKEESSRKEYQLLKEINNETIIKAEEFIVADGWTYAVIELAQGQEL
jgi:hypothetical protein